VQVSEAGAEGGRHTGQGRARALVPIDWLPTTPEPWVWCGRNLEGLTESQWRVLLDKPELVFARASPQVPSDGLVGADR
jgi:hypothetical protein